MVTFRTVNCKAGERLMLLVESIKSKKSISPIILCHGPHSVDFLSILFDLLEYEVLNKVGDVASSDRHIYIIDNPSDIEKVTVKNGVLYAYDPVPMELDTFKTTVASTPVKSCYLFQISDKATVRPKTLATLDRLAQKHYSLRRSGEQAYIETFRVTKNRALCKTDLYKSYLLPTVIRPPAKTFD